MRIILSCLLFTFVFFPLNMGWAQPEDSTFYSLENALENPSKVKVLDLYYTELGIVDWDTYEYSTKPQEHLNLIMEQIGKFPNLEDCSIYSESYEYLTEDMMVYLEEIPESWAELKNLKFFTISGIKCLETEGECHIKGLENLQSLEVFVWNNSNLKTIPQEVFTLKNLQGLGLGFNQIQSIPSELGEMKTIRAVNFQSNQIQEFPITFYNLPALQLIYLNENKIEEIPSGIENLKRLKQLNLSNCNLTTLHPEMSKLDSLEFLNVSFNSIKSLDPVSGLPNIKYLWASNNKITTLPAFTTDSILSIYVGWNEIEEFPNWILQKPAIEALGFEGNELTCVPIELFEKEFEYGLDLSHNPFDCEPEVMMHLFNNYLRYSVGYDDFEITKVDEKFALEINGSTQLIYDSFKIEDNGSINFTADGQKYVIAIDSYTDEYGYLNEFNRLIPEENMVEIQGSQFMFTTLNKTKFLCQYSDYGYYFVRDSCKNCELSILESSQNSYPGNGNFFTQRTYPNKILVNNWDYTGDTSLMMLPDHQPQEIYILNYYYVLLLAKNKKNGNYYLYDMSAYSENVYNDFDEYYGISKVTFPIDKNAVDILQNADSLIRVYAEYDVEEIESSLDPNKKYAFIRSDAYNIEITDNIQDLNFPDGTRYYTWEEAYENRSTAQFVEISLNETINTTLDFSEFPNLKSLSLDFSYGEAPLIMPKTVNELTIYYGEYKEGISLDLSKIKNIESFKTNGTLEEIKIPPSLKLLDLSYSNHKLTEKQVDKLKKKNPDLELRGFYYAEYTSNGKYYGLKVNGKQALENKYKDISGFDSDPYRYYILYEDDHMHIYDIHTKKMVLENFTELNYMNKMVAIREGSLVVFSIEDSYYAASEANNDLKIEQEINFSGSYDEFYSSGGKLVGWGDEGFMIYSNASPNKIIEVKFDENITGLALKDDYYSPYPQFFGDMLLVTTKKGRNLYDLNEKNLVFKNGFDTFYEYRGMPVTVKDGKTTFWTYDFQFANQLNYDTLIQVAGYYDSYLVGLNKNSADIFEYEIQPVTFFEAPSEIIDFKLITGYYEDSKLKFYTKDSIYTFTTYEFELTQKSAYQPVERVTKVVDLSVYYGAIFSMSLKERTIYSDTITYDYYFDNNGKAVYNQDSIYAKQGRYIDYPDEICHLGNGGFVEKEDSVYYLYDYDTYDKASDTGYQYAYNYCGGLFWVQDFDGKVYLINLDGEIFGGYKYDALINAGGGHFLALEGKVNIEYEEVETYKNDHNKLYRPFIERREKYEYDGTWYLIRPDGTRVKIEIP